MGFYKNKLKTYTRNQNMQISSRLMEWTRQRMIAVLENYVKELEVEISTYSARASYLGFGSDRDVSNEYLLAEKELDFVKSLPTSEFYNYFANVENYNLINIEKTINEKIYNLQSKVQKYQGREGLSAKLTNADRKLEKNRDLLKKEETDLGYVMSSRVEFQGLAPEEKLSYIIGRFEIDKNVKFNKAEFDKYMTAYANSIQNENSGNTSNK